MLIIILGSIIILLLFLILKILCDIRGENHAKNVEMADQLQFGLVECRRLTQILRNALKKSKKEVAYPLSRSEGSASMLRPVAVKFRRTKTI